MKIAVYAICKNESKFINRWYNSMKEADGIYVLDTGSTDNSVELLKSLNVNVVSKIISPWRFDVARNLSLQLVPEDYDLCVCTDIDEVFNEGWRKIIEDNYKPGTTRIKYTYNWFIENNIPKVFFWSEKIHIRNNYKWVYPVHEILRYDGKEKELYLNDLILNHYPDRNKSRSSYLKLLELSVKENPDDDRALHYLGREYMYYSKWDVAIEILTKHLNLCKWDLEKNASMRFIARCYKYKKCIKEARDWYQKAIDLSPNMRDAYIELALLEYEQKNYDEVIKLCDNALKITDCKKLYINEVFSWDHTVYDLLSLAYYYKGNYKEAFKNINKALEITNDERLVKNKNIIKKELD